MARSFRFLKTLGEGAFGAVHLAEVREDETDFVQTLAVKWLHERWSQSAEYAKRLRDEARLLALLRHEAIVRVHGLARIDGRLAVLMEPVEGADLGRVARMPARAAAEVCAAVADALDAAWSETPPGQSDPLHVVHRDIKPSNVMVTPRGTVKVMDFGVARATFDSREAETRSQQFGTARYMAPERWLEGVAEAPSDVFSLGVTVLELVAGEPMPQPRLSREGFEADLGGALVALDALPELRALVAEMVAFHPADRPTAEAVARRSQELVPALPGPGLRAWAVEAAQDLRNPGVETSLTGTVVREESNASGSTLDWDSLEGTDVAAVPTVAPLATHEIGPPPTRTPPRRGRMPVLAFSLVALGLLGIVGSRMLWPEQTAPPLPPEPTLSAPVPAPEAAPEPVVQPEPEPAPVPAPAAPAPRPRPAPVVAPEPEPVEEPVPPAPALGTVRFELPAGVSVETAAKTITQRRDAVELPQGVAQITVVDGERRHRCEILVGASLTDVRIQPDLSCAQ